jgi:RHS repeat-associated protein
MGRVVATTSPDTGTTVFAYDEAGNLALKTDAKGVTTQYDFDALNRLTTIDFPLDADITYSYDEGTNGKGHRTGMTDASGSTSFAYDSRGRLVDKTSTLNDYPTVSYQLTRTFTPGSRLFQVTYPSGRSVNYYRYRDSGKIKLVTTPHIYNGWQKILMNNITYYPFGGIKSMSTGYGTRIYNQQSECGCVEAANPGEPMEQTYTYYDDGNLDTISGTTTSWFNQDFDYDNLGQLNKAIGTYGTADFTYDRVGNRQSRTIDGQAESYLYFSGTNLLQSVTGTETVNYTYDSNGNPTGIGNRVYNYNQNNQLVQVQDGGVITDYAYNGLGQRVLKDVGGVITIFHYDFGGNIIGESQTDGSFFAEYIYRGRSRVAQVDTATGEIYYYQNNHLGTPLMLVDKTNTVVWEADYKPFGDADVNQISSVSGVTNNFRFPGQYYDEETGLHYNYFRYYDPKTGRYLTADPIGQIGGINLYIYVLNNPVNLVDIFGLESMVDPYSQAGSNPFPTLPTFTEAFPNSTIVAPFADIIVGGD